MSYIILLLCEDYSRLFVMAIYIYIPCTTLIDQTDITDSRHIFTLASHSINNSFFLKRMFITIGKDNATRILLQFRVSCFYFHISIQRKCYNKNIMFMSVTVIRLLQSIYLYPQCSHFRIIFVYTLNSRTV